MPKLLVTYSMGKCHPNMLCSYAYDKLLQRDPLNHHYGIVTLQSPPSSCCMLYIILIDKFCVNLLEYID